MRERDGGEERGKRTERKKGEGSEKREKRVTESGRK